MSDLPFDQGGIYDWIPEKKAKYYNIHRLACGFDNKMALISMICSLMQAFIHAGKELTFLELVNKLADGNSTDLKEELADLCEAFYDKSYKYNNYGFKSAKDMKVEINRILDLELPF